MTKDRLIEVLSKVNENGADTGFFHDEIQTIIGVLQNSVSQEDVDKAYAELREDDAQE